MQNIQSVLSEREFSFLWSDNFHETNVMVRIPNLMRSSFNHWADWGPMYEFDVSVDDPVCISYNSNKRVLENRILRIESPPLIAERRDYPLYIRVEDDMRNINFKLYLNNNFELGKVEINRGNEDYKRGEVSISVA